MRLIDADAFREQLNSAYEYTELGEVIEMLDNAPTAFDDKAYSQGYKQGTCDSKYDRPQGEWYRTGQSFINPDKFRNYGCSNCFYELDEHIRKEPNFCPNCGADMRGGKE